MGTTYSFSYIFFVFLQTFKSVKTVLALGWIWPEGHSLMTPELLNNPFCGSVKQKANRIHNTWASVIQHCDIQFSDLLRDAPENVYWSGENLILPLTESQRTFLPRIVSKNNLFHSVESAVKKLNRSAITSSKPILGTVLSRQIQVLL